MDNTDPIYNIDFVSNLRDTDDCVYEKMKIMNRIDKEVSGNLPFVLMHLVPIFYSIAFISGCSVFIYKIII